MTNGLSIVVTASSGNEAEIIAGVLKEAGIPAFVEGQDLADGLAVAQRTLGQMSVEVKVPTDLLEKAQEVLEEARESGREMSEDERSGE